MTQEGECHSGEVAAATKTAYHDIGIFAGHLHLLFSLKTDDSLMQRHMIENRAERILTVRRSHGKLHGFGYSRTERTLIVRVLRNNLSSGLGRHTRRGYNLSAISLHDGATVWLLMIRHLDHIHGQFKAEVTGGKRQSRTPLARTGLGGYIGHALLLAVVSLRYGGIQLMRPYRTHTLVFEIYMCRSIERFFKTAGTHQRSRTPYTVHLAHLFRYLYPAVGIVKLLTRHLLGEERKQILRLHRLLGDGVKQRPRLAGHIGHHIVPSGRDIFFL